MIFDDIIYNSKTGQFFNKSGKEIDWVNGSGYMFITVGKKAIRAHRLAWYKVYGYFPTKEIDHINGIKTDNRIENLREVDRVENMHNLKCHRNGHKPCIKKRYNKFAVYATKNKVRKYIGLFSTEEDAIKAYDEYMSI